MNFTEQDTIWMQHALQLAERAADNNEVPVGALLVKDNQIIGEGWNRPIQENDPSAHAEIVTLRHAGKIQQNYRLIDSTLYVTLEPCVMCVGALVHARIKQVIFGAFDKKGGAVTSCFELGHSNKFNHKIIFHGGLLAERCGSLLTEFFKKKR